MPIAAVIGAAAIGAGAQIISGNKAAKAQKQAADQSLQLQREQDAEAARQFDLQRSDLAPYREAGTVALGQIGRGTADGGEFNRKFTMADFTADPGYEFRRSEGQRGIEAGASARGGVLSGGAMKALQRFNSDLASQEFGSAFNRYQTDLGGRYNRLANVAGIGQQAVNSGNQASQVYVDNRQAGTNNAVNAVQGAGNARASQYVNTGNAIGGAANSIGSYFGTQSLLRQIGGGGGGMTSPGSFVPGVGYLGGTTLPVFGRR
jgi:hypothetical protein